MSPRISGLMAAFVAGFVVELAGTEGVEPALRASLNRCAVGCCADTIVATAAVMANL